MPIARKQSPAVKQTIGRPEGTAKGPAAVSNGAPAPGDSSVQRMKLLCYGRGKTGKTRLAATYPKPMLLIGIEDGTKSVATGRTEKKRLRNDNIIYSLTLAGKPTGIDFIKLTASSEMDELLPMLVEDGYRSTGLDHASGFQDLILKEILGLNDIPVQKSWGMTDRQTWGVVGMQFKQRMSALLDLEERAGLAICIIAHERSFGDSEDASNLMLPSIGAALTPSAAGWLNTACDYICQCFIREKYEEQVIEGADDPNAKVRVATGKAEYCLRVGAHAIYQTGFRLPPGIELPDVITDPSYKKVAALIRGEKL